MQLSCAYAAAYARTATVHRLCYVLPASHETIGGEYLLASSSLLSDAFSKSGIVLPTIVQMMDTGGVSRVG